VDFQTSKVGSRILDLSYLFFTSVRNDVLNRHYFELLRVYFDSFQQFISVRTNQKAPLSFQGHELTWEAFKEEWNEYKFYGLMLAILYAPPSKGDRVVVFCFCFFAKNQPKPFNPLIFSFSFQCLQRLRISPIWKS